MKLLILILAAVFQFSAFAETDAGKYDFKVLMEKCDKDFEGYQNSLRFLRPKFKKEIDSMSQAEFDKGSGKDDPRILFVSINWPADLEAKDDGWRRYEDCAADNFAAAKAISNNGSAKAEKLEKSTDVEHCMHVAYDKNKLLFPLDRLIACYQKHSKE